MDNQNLIKKLKKYNIKVTPQRLGILKYLEEFRTHPDAEEIYHHVQKEYPSISLATIYNTLEILVELNELKKLKIAVENRVNYDIDLTPHHHFYCNRCNKIFDIPPKGECKTDDTIQGHHIDEIAIYYKGICKSCS